MRLSADRPKIARALGTEARKVQVGMQCLNLGDWLRRCARGQQGYNYSAITCLRDLDRLDPKPRSRLLCHHVDFLGILPGGSFDQQFLTS